MKLEINLRLFVLIIIFFLINRVDTYLIFLIFILLHELAHLFVGIIFGGKLNSLRIGPFGISLDLLFYKNKKIFINLLYYSIGPIVNLFIAFLFKNMSYFEDCKTTIIYTNLFLFVFNLLPIIPLDGGNILFEILKVFIGRINARIATMYFSKMILFIISFSYSIAIIKIKNIYILILIVYLWYLYYIEEKKINLLVKIKKIVNNDKIKI